MLYLEYFHNTLKLTYKFINAIMQIWDLKKIKEAIQVIYDGAAWNYSGSGYKNASFKYTRNGKILLSKTLPEERVQVWFGMI